MILDEMAQIGHIGEYQIYVRTNDPGKIPHFHIWDYETMGQKFHTCVQIKDAKYFHHTGKEGTLNSEERKELDSFLRQPFRTDKFSSNWELLIFEWNLNNSDTMIPEDFHQPDYTKLQ